MVNRGAEPRGLFVVGAPRTGTTLQAQYLASGPRTLNLGEFGAFNLAYRVAPGALGRIPGPFRDEYLADLARLARAFAMDLANQQGLSWYCDCTPWNILVADRLAEDQPDALFVLTLRHYAGAVQSFRRWSEAGSLVTGRTWEEAAGIWSLCYGAVEKLPDERTVVVSYDALALDPEPTLAALCADLEAKGFDTTGLDPGQLAVSHASASEPRPTVAKSEQGRLELTPFSSFAANRWSGDLQNLVWPVVRDAHRALQARFGELYRLPPKPEGLRVHDEVNGLVQFEIEEW